MNHHRKPASMTTGLPLLTMLVTLSLILWASPPVQAQSQGPQGGVASTSSGKRIKQGRGGWAKRVNLTAEQVQQLESIKLEYQKETADLKNEIYKKDLEISGLVRDPGARDTDILELQKQRIALKAKMMEQRAEYQLKGRSLLTPEQIRQLPPEGCGLGFLGRGQRSNRRLGQAP